jgi:hypothetical protein
VIVDSKLYPEGYHVRLRSKPYDANQPISLLPALATTPATTGDDSTTASAQAAAQSEPPEPPFLPLKHTVHTLPSSPLHSSGLAVDHPPRHLLRLMLPTAQTQISTLLDPLTGETRAPPPKPQWMLELGEKGAVIEVEIQPATPSLGVGGGKKARGGGATVMIDGVVVEVEGEKESLTSVGREELQDDRVAWLAVLSRCVGCMRGRHGSFYDGFGADETRSGWCDSFCCPPRFICGDSGILAKMRPTDYRRNCGARPRLRTLSWKLAGDQRKGRFRRLRKGRRVRVREIKRETRRPRARHANVPFLAGSP